ncbi:hypothetical protein [Anaerotignum sp.]|uniref:hypothetical protein n=1 Tax=Anaerotignum sp. TaxID=2039241 RepID=UPI0028AF6134|nr:hypothetical protein [Anaerotignum sp.]
MFYSVNGTDQAVHFHYSNILNFADAEETDNPTSKRARKEQSNAVMGDDGCLLHSP